MNHKNTGQSGSLIYINEPENYSKFLDYGASTENGARLALRIMMTKQRRFTSVRTMLHFLGS